jgi:hypothetical protein
MSMDLTHARMSNCDCSLRMASISLGCRDSSSLGAAAALDGAARISSGGVVDVSFGGAEGLPIGDNNLCQEELAT